MLMPRRGFTIRHLSFEKKTIFSSVDAVALAFCTGDGDGDGWRRASDFDSQELTSERLTGTMAGAKGQL